MGQYITLVGGTLIGGTCYNKNKHFASPMKEMNEKTVLVEDSQFNVNNSFRQRTKYNDQIELL